MVGRWFMPQEMYRERRKTGNKRVAVLVAKEVQNHWNYVATM